MYRIAISGYFDPLHIGHLELIRVAKKIGDVIVIVNNDKQAMLKKGYSFMPEDQRLAIVSALRDVSMVVLSIDDDLSVCKTLEHIRPHFFGNGGDRHQGEIPEKTVCDEFGIEMIDGLGDKIQSSSELVKKSLNSKVDSE